MRLYRWIISWTYIFRERPPDGRVDDYSINSVDWCRQAGVPDPPRHGD